MSSVTKPVRRVLIVEDSRSVQNILREMVTSIGWEVEQAHSGPEALAKLSRDVDLVLLDIVMPGMDGYEVAHRIRQDTDHRDVPILVVTSLGGEQYRNMAEEVGVDDFLPKPVKADELQRRMEAALEKRARA